MVKILFKVIKMPSQEHLASPITLFLHYSSQRRFLKNSSLPVIAIYSSPHYNSAHFPHKVTETFYILDKNNWALFNPYSSTLAIFNTIDYSFFHNWSFRAFPPKSLTTPHPRLQDLLPFFPLSRAPIDALRTVLSAIFLFIPY